jgi:hypothetical protein
MWQLTYKQGDLIWIVDANQADQHDEWLTGRLKESGQEGYALKRHCAQVPCKL